MARPKRFATRRACERKMTYSTELAARMGAQATLATVARAREFLFVYACPCCGKWHVTHDGRGGRAVTRTQLFAMVEPV